MSLNFAIEMAWKSAFISAAALAAHAAIKGRASADRSLILKSAVVLLLVLPAAALWFPQLAVVTRTIELPAPHLGQVPQIAAPVSQGPYSVPSRSWSDLIELAPLLWAAGCAALILRLISGLVLLGRLSRSGREVMNPAWDNACARAASAIKYRRPVLLRVADVRAPLHWGWRRPVILIDPITCANPGDAESVLAHEFSHIARHDWPAIILARLAVALFWPNPFVWLLERQLVDAIEEAADASAVRFVEPRKYAQSLLNCASKMVGGYVPAIGIADRGLARRLPLLLDERFHWTAPNPRTVSIVLTILTALAAPVAALKPVTAYIYLASRQVASTPPVSRMSTAQRDLGDLRTQMTAAIRTRSPLLRSIESIPGAALNETSEAIQTAEGRDQRTMAVAMKPIVVPMKPIAVDMDPVSPSLPPSSNSQPGSDDRAVYGYGATRRLPDIGDQITAGVLAGLGRDFLKRADALDAEAARLQSKSYRDSLIAKGAADGHPVTDEQLLARMSKMKSDATYLREHSFGQWRRPTSDGGP